MSTVPNEKPPKPVSGSSWRQLVRSHVHRDEAELASLRTRNGDAGDLATIQKMLSHTREITERPRSLRSWWTGSYTDEAWMNVHEADAQIDQHLRGAELRAHAQDLVMKGMRTLPHDDARLVRIQNALSQPDGGPHGEPLEPVYVAHLARAISATSDERYAQSRSFRNRIIRLSIISLVVLGLLTLTFSSNVINIEVTEAGNDATPIQLLGVISAFGAVGALISGVPPLAKVSGTWNPYSLPFYQMLLKLVLGPIFAIVGVMMLQSGVVPDIQAPMPLPDLLVWALVFGASQQLVTHLVDNRVSGMVSSEPSERTDLRRPEQSG